MAVAEHAAPGSGSPPPPYMLARPHHPAPNPPPSLSASFWAFLAKMPRRRWTGGAVAASSIPLFPIPTPRSAKNRWHSRLASLLPRPTSRSPPSSSSSPSPSLSPTRPRCWHRAPPHALDRSKAWPRLPPPPPRPPIPTTEAPAARFYPPPLHWSAIVASPLPR